MPYGVVNADKMTTSDGVSSSGLYGFKNRILNGQMVIDQRNAGASVTSTSNPFTLDRWQAFGAPGAKYTVQQNAGSVTPPAGFSKYLGITSSSAYTVTSGDYFFLTQHIEGFNVADLGFGAAGASTVTLSFWVRSSLTGSFGGSLANGAENRSYPFTYTISSANTWEQKSITVAGDTTGTWATGNTSGLEVNFGYGVGSGLSGTANGTWQTGDYRSATGTTSVVGTNGATFYITGVQLEKGSTATSFDYRPYTTELSLCQRYLPAWRANEAGNGYGFNGQAYSTTQALIILPFNVPARTRPTGIVVSSSSDFGLLNTNATALNAAGTVSFNQSTNFALMVGVSGSSGIVAGNATMMAGLNTSAYIYATGCEL